MVAGHFDEALAAHQRALEIRRERLGPRHPEMAVTMNNLALVYIHMGEPQRAIPMLRETIEIRMDSIGVNHPATCSSLGNLARAYMETGDFDRALPQFDLAIQTAESTMGEDQIMPIVFRANRGECLGRMGRTDEAEAVLLSEYENATEMLGAEHFRSQRIAIQIAELFEGQDQPDRAAQWKRRSGM